MILAYCKLPQHYRKKQASSEERVIPDRQESDCPEAIGVDIGLACNIFIFLINLVGKIFEKELSQLENDELECLKSNVIAQDL